MTAQPFRPGQIVRRRGYARLFRVTDVDQFVYYNSDTDDDDTDRDGPYLRVEAVDSCRHTLMDSPDSFEHVPVTEQLGLF